MKTRFSPDLPTSGALIIPLLEGELDRAVIKTLDDATEKAVSRSIKATEFKGKSGQSLTIAGPAGMEDAVIILMGLGKAEKADPHDGLNIGGKAIAATKGKFAEVAFDLTGLTFAGDEGVDLATKAALGAVLKAYEFEQYRVKTADKDKKPLESFTIVTDAASDAEAAFKDMDAVKEGVFLARDLVGEPANILYPESFANRCKELEKLGVKVTVLDEKKMTELGMGSLLGVGQGSIRESQLVAMEWMGGAKDQKPVAFVGKGVTFDTGGISLKPGQGMEDMKFDMGGAAAVTGAMHALASRKAKTNVVGLIGLVENMPDGNAQRPGDVVKSMSGQTVEVINTDAEGRLVLADVLTYAQETYKPQAIVDLATLTGAILISLAHEYAGLFTKNDAFAEQLLASANNSGELLWRMPLGKAHDEMIKSDIADMKNIGGRWGGSSSAAAFLARFVEEDVPWAHLDIAGMAWAYKETDICPKGASGFGVRLLDQLIRDNYEG